MSPVAIIVTFNPPLDRLNSLVACLVDATSAVVLVDNGSREDPERAIRTASPQIHWIHLGENLGVAAAINRGIDRARKLGATHVLLFDHDSVPAPDMIERLLEAMASLEARGVRVGAIGPRYLDRRHGNPPPFLSVEGLRLIRHPCEAGSERPAVDYVVTSGSVIPLSTLDAVGGMADSLFVDYVDIEWGLRAARAGYQSFGVCAAHMDHSLGDATVRFGARNIAMHSPLRHYYLMRNAIWLYRQRWVPLNWKIVDAVRLVRRYVFYAIYGRPRVQHVQMMTKGLWHGLIGLTGKYR